MALIADVHPSEAEDFETELRRAKRSLDEFEITSTRRSRSPTAPCDLPCGGQHHHQEQADRRSEDLPYWPRFGLDHGRHRRHQGRGAIAPNDFELGLRKAVAIGAATQAGGRNGAGPK